MKYGYYLAASNTLHGDHELALAACNRWHDLGYPPVNRDAGCPGPDRYAGVSVWIEDDGSPHVRIIAQDFFSTRFKVAQAMIVDGW